MGKELSGKWEMVKLGDVCEIVSGTTPKTNEERFWNGVHNWITPAELNENTVEVFETQRKITDFAISNKSLKKLPSGTVLLSSRAPIGKVAIAGTDMFCNQGFKNMICSNEINNKFLYWFLKGKKEYLNSLGRGATFKEISKAIVEEIEIPLPPLEIQKEIARNLDLASELVKLHKRKLEELDKLIQSVFYDMFGDPVANEMGWEVRKLGEVCIKITDGKHGGCEIRNEETGYYFIGAREINNGYINYENAPQISRSEFEKDYKRCNTENGDFVIVNTGATIGKSAILNHENTTKTLLQKSVALIKCDKNNLKPVYLKYCYSLNKSMYKVVSASAQPNLLLSKIRETDILLPSLLVQQKFAEIVNEIEIQKLQVQITIDDTQMLYNRLMQDYFNQKGKIQ